MAREANAAEAVDRSAALKGTASDDAILDLSIEVLLSATPMRHRGRVDREFIAQPSFLALFLALAIQLKADPGLTCSSEENWQEYPGGRANELLRYRIRSDHRHRFLRATRNWRIEILSEGGVSIDAEAPHRSWVDASGRATWTPSDVAWIVARLRLIFASHRI